MNKSLIIAKHDAKKALRCGDERLESLIRAKLLQERYWGNMIGFSAKQVNDLVEKIFDPEFPNNFKDAEQRSVVIELFMTPEQVKDILMNKSSRNIYAKASN